MISYVLARLFLWKLDGLFVAASYANAEALLGVGPFS